eukprot:6624567-Pyramimonas_sp.AAC.1
MPPNRPTKAAERLVAPLISDQAFHFRGFASPQDSEAFEYLADWIAPTKSEPRRSLHKVIVGSYTRRFP